jgi:predicted deacylase
MTEDILTVLTAFGVLPGTLRQNQSQTVFRKAVYTESDTEGLWYPYIQENENVRRGQILGEVRNFRNEILQTVSAEGDGIVLYFTPGLSARPGWPLVAYGLSEKLTE